MSLYHLSVGIVGRSGGKSSVASFAYQSRTKIEDKETAIVYDYRQKGKKDPVLQQGEFFTDKMLQNDFCRTGADFWNEVQKKENRKNSQFARDFDIALQSELSLEDNLNCLTEWYSENFLSRDIGGTYAIHGAHEGADGESNKNIHAHVMCATRKLTADGWGEKDRDGNDREFLKQARSSWARIVNNKFQELGMEERIDERTLEEQGIDREPQQHQGVTATAMTRKGKTPDRKKYKNQEQEEKVEVTEEELQAELQTDKEFQNFLFLKQTNDGKLKFADDVINDFCRTGDTNRLYTQATFFRAVSVACYVTSNENEERNYYNRFIGSTQAELQKKRLNKIIDDSKRSTHFNDKEYDRINLLIAYEKTTKDKFPDHYPKLISWFKETTNIIASSCRNAFNKLSNFIQRNYNIVNARMQEHNNQINIDNGNGHSR